MSNTNPSPQHSLDNETRSAFRQVFGETGVAEIEDLIQTYDIPIRLAADLHYLRGRSRWSHNLEGALLRCFRELGITNFKITIGEEASVLGDLGYWSTKLQEERQKILQRNERLRNYVYRKEKILSTLRRWLRRILPTSRQDKSVELEP